jgi:hypothetical protein
MPVLLLPSGQQAFCTGKTASPAASSKAFTNTPISRRERVRGRCIDGGRPARHWTAVKLEIARRQGIAIGLAGADLRG